MLHWKANRFAGVPPSSKRMPFVNMHVAASGTVNTRNLSHDIPGMRKIKQEKIRGGAMGQGIGEAFRHFVVADRASLHRFAVPSRDFAWNSWKFWVSRKRPPQASLCSYQPPWAYDNGNATSESFLSLF